MMINLTLALPALNWAGGTPLPPLDTPALNQLLRFGKFHARPCGSSRFYAAHLWQGSLLGAAKKALGVPLEQAALFASPVWQQMGMHSMSVLDGAEIGVSEAEAARLCGELSDFYADDGWRFSVYRPDLWLVSLPETPDWQAPCVLDVLGQVDGTMRADGAEARDWLGRQTEMQMWLHAHAVNGERAARGVPAINGVWLWQDAVGSQEGMPLLGSDSAWAGAYSGVRLDAPYDYAAWCSMVAEQAASAQQVLFLDDLVSAAHTADVWAYQQTLLQWETRFFEPVWQDLRAGRLSGLSVETDGEAGGCLQVAGKAGRAFWKKSKVFEGRLF